MTKQPFEFRHGQHPPFGEGLHLELVRGFALTLDWDFSYSEALKLFVRFLVEERPVGAELYFSALKGFHVEAKFRQPISLLRMRDKWKDDGNRVVFDIMRNDPEINQILWREKVLHREGQFLVMRRVLCLKAAVGAAEGIEFG